jgi:hypothetical protein
MSANAPRTTIASFAFMMRSCDAASANPNQEWGAKIPRTEIPLAWAARVYASPLMSEQRRALTS